MTLRVVFAIFAGIAILVLIFSPEKSQRTKDRKAKVVLAIATIGLTIGFIAIFQQQDSLNATNNRICAALTYLTPQLDVPKPDGSEIQDQRIKAIKKSNMLRAKARAKLGAKLGCDG